MSGALNLCKGKAHCFQRPNFAALILNFGAPVKTGKEQVVQVHYGEGVAIRIGPEPCVGTREGDGEASVGERIGQPLSVCCSSMRKES